MGCKLNFSNPPLLCKLSTSKPGCRIKRGAFSSYSPSQQDPISRTIASSHGENVRTINFMTMKACKLGISRYPDFEYNAEGGKGTGTGTGTGKNLDGEELSVSFDLETVYIPPLTSTTTKFLGLPMPPFLNIDIVPELFRGSIDQESGRVDLEFTAKFLFSVGSIYRAPPLLVKTVLTSEESSGETRSGRGERLDKEGKCRLVGVATVDPIDDLFMNTFLGLQTECLADLNAVISVR